MPGLGSGAILFHADLVHAGFDARAPEQSWTLRIEGMTAELKNWFGDLAPGQAAIARDLRSLILSRDAALREELKWGQPCYSRKALIFYIQKSKRYVSLGFGHGAMLDDPLGILDGAGSQMRHLKFAVDQTPDFTYAAGFIDAALELGR